MSGEGRRVEVQNPGAAEPELDDSHPGDSVQLAVAAIAAVVAELAGHPESAVAAEPEFVHPDPGNSVFAAADPGSAVVAELAGHPESAVAAVVVVDDSHSGDPVFFATDPEPTQFAWATRVPARLGQEVS
jgi:hypothetical protein